MNNAQIIKTIAKEIFEGHFNKDVIKSSKFIKEHDLSEVVDLDQSIKIDKVAGSTKISKEEFARYSYFDCYVDLLNNKKLNIEGKRAVVFERLKEEFIRIKNEEDRRQFKENPPEGIIQYEDVTNIDGKDYEGKVLVLHPLVLNAQSRTRENQIWLATGGFGCSPTALGTRVYATCLSDGEQSSWRRGDFMGMYNGKLTEQQYAKLEELLQPKIERLEKRLEAGQEIGAGGWRYELEGDAREEVKKELNELYTLFTIYGGGK